MEHITSKNNRWIRLAIRLKQKKYRDKNKMFLMEGLRNAEDVQNQEISDIVCLVQSGRAENGSVQHIFERGENLHWLFCEVEEPLMRLISGTENGQGIILLVKQPYVMDYPQLLNGWHGKYVLLDTVRDPGNVGAIIRTAAAAGCSGVLLTKGSADPYSEKVVRSSMGSILRLPIYHDLDIEFLKEIKSFSKVPFIGTSLSASQNYRHAKFVTEGVFIFGNEGSGISPEILDLTDWNVFIPMAGTVESLNVSSTAAIILFYYLDDNEFNN